ncbi:unnamed protein product [Acanthosepion pharaonis]|uniref:Uncharacterized protein n=1 Tax=Acanthosepion pharaonis TaxID=158019 RepID=A0A812CF27_ACAPH|nr:unnamed protein product [Sepia pharaonis]
MSLFLGLHIPLSSNNFTYFYLFLSLSIPHFISLSLSVSLSTFITLHLNILLHLIISRSISHSLNVSRSLSLFAIFPTLIIPLLSIAFSSLYLTSLISCKSLYYPSVPEYTFPSCSLSTISLSLQMSSSFSRSHFLLYLTLLFSLKPPYPPLYKPHLSLFSLRLNIHLSFILSRSISHSLNVPMIFSRSHSLLYLTLLLYKIPLSYPPDSARSFHPLSSIYIYIYLHVSVLLYLNIFICLSVTTRSNLSIFLYLIPFSLSLSLTLFHHPWK